MPHSFIKMNGAGNDFIILDARDNPLRLTTQQVKAIAARDNATTGGCDQVIILEMPRDEDAKMRRNDDESSHLHLLTSSHPHIFMRIYNADGSEVDACGNATRCVASLMEEELQRLPVTIQTNAGTLQGIEKAYTPDEEEYILVDMGAPKFDWQAIPLAMPVEEAAQAIKQKLLSLIPNPSSLIPHFINMGNPHVVFFLRFAPNAHSERDDAPLFDLDFERIGPLLENATDIFPERVNVSIALLRAAGDGLGHIIHARVWERGAGLTQACGTAACAMLAAAHQRDASVRDVTLWFEPFGTMVTVQMDDNGHILLGGPVEVEFRGTLEL